MNRPIRTLLVEDNPGDALLLRESLRDAGDADQFALTHVTRLNDAVERLASTSFDLVVLDLSLPDAHGLETIGRLRPHASGTPIVLLTGLNDESVARQALEEGAQGYLVKGDAAHTVEVLRAAADSRVRS